MMHLFRATGKMHNKVERLEKNVLQVPGGRVLVAESLPLR